MKHKSLKSILLVLLAMVSMEMSADTTYKIIYYVYDSSNPTDYSKVVKDTTFVSNQGTPLTQVRSIYPVEIDGTTYPVGTKFVYIALGTTATVYTTYVPVRLAYKYEIIESYVDGSYQPLTDTNRMFVYYEYVSGEYRKVDWNYTYPLYTQSSEGIWYKAKTTTTFGEEGSVNNFNEGDKIMPKPIIYSKAADDMQNIVLFCEGEDPTRGGISTGLELKYSDGAAGYVVGGKSYSLGTLSAGVYNITAKCTESGKAAMVLCIDGVSQGVTLCNTIGEKSVTLTLEKSASVSLLAQGKRSNSFDYVMVQMLKEGVSVGDVGQGTYASSHNLDFSDCSDMKVYRIVVDSKDTYNAKTVSVTTVPAKEGIYLKSKSGAATTVYPTVVNSVTAWDDDKNLLVGVLESTKVYMLDKSYTYYNYALNKQNNIVNFYKIPRKGNYMRANSAYLQFPFDTRAVADAKEYILLDDDNETTGVTSVETVTDTNDIIYNLAGQKVGSDYKGIIIKNGHKYMNK